MLRNKQGFIAKIMTKVNMIGLVAKAEEPNTTGTEPQGETTAPTTTTPAINYEDLIARARKEEKDKLYPKIQKLEGENASLVEKHNKALLTIANKDQEIEELKARVNNTNATDSEEVKNLKAEIKELKKQVKEYEANIVDPEKIREEISAEYEVKLYKEQKLREVGEEVIPELVFGNTKEEIDQSIEVAKSRYQSIVGKYKTPEVPPANVNTSSMNIGNLNADDIAKMTPAQWSEYRKQLNLR